MFVNFRFDNFLSYNDLTHFSLVAGNTRRHSQHVVKHPDVSVLKFAALYGANASGKSNLIKAIKFSRQLILYGFPKVISRDLQSKIDKGNLHRDTSFEYEILLDGVVYAYGFSINLLEKSVQKEWLYRLEHNKEVEVYSRDKSKNPEVSFNYEQFPLSDSDKMRLQFYLDDAIEEAPNSLLLLELNKNKTNFYINKEKFIINTLFNWFKNKLEVIDPDKPTEEAHVFYFEKKKQLKLSSFLHAFGTGITEVKTERIEEKDLFKDIPSNIVKDILDNIENNSGGMLRTNNNIYDIERVNHELKIKTVLFKHEMNDVYYSLNEESDGTKRLIEIYNILISETEKVYVIDELDRSLHPNLTYKFIKRFLEKENDSQLIVTTHEDRLLDLNVLRRDEIWFVEKKSNGASKLYSLEAFKERFDKDVLKAYLEGRYGSVPKFKTLV